MKYSENLVSVSLRGTVDESLEDDEEWPEDWLIDLHIAIIDKSGKVYIEEDRLLSHEDNKTSLLAISDEKLFDPKENLLSESGELHLSFELKFRFKGYFYINQQEKFMTSHLREILRNSFFDITLISQDFTIKAHKFVLAGNFPYIFGKVKLCSKSPLFQRQALFFTRN